MIIRFKHLLLTSFLFVFILELSGQINQNASLDLIYPKINQTLTKKVNFSWNAYEAASSYTLQIARDQLFTNVFFSDSDLVETHYQYNLDSSDIYFWRIIASNGSQNIDTSESWTFNIFSPQSMDSLRLWLIGDSVGLSTLNRVQFWYDLSDPNKSINQTNSARQADYIPNYINGFGVVDFPNIRPSVYFSVCNIQTAAYTVSSVYNWHGAVGASSKLVNSQTAGNFWNLGPDLSHTLRQQSGYVGNGLAIEQDRFVLNTAFSNGDSVANIINGIQVGKEPFSRAPQFLRVSIGNNDNMNGAVAEIVAYEGRLTELEQKRLDNYLMDKYAPPISLGQDRIVCQLPDSISLSNDYIISYLWSTGETTPNIRFDTSGLYTIQATDIFGRVSYDSIRILEDTINYMVDLGADTIIRCDGDEVNLVSNLNQSRFQYLWNTGDTLPYITVTQPGKYVLNVQNCRGIISTDSVIVFFNNPVFSLGNDTIACHNELLNLVSDSIFQNVTYNWSTNESTQAITATQNGSYSLTVTDAFNCAYSDTINISIDSTLYQISLGADTTLCGGNSIGLENPPNNITSYLWSTGNQQALQVIDTSGQYSILVGNGQCFESDTINIIIKGEAPSVGFTTDILCENEAVVFTNTTNDPNNISLVSYKWDFGDGDTSIAQHPTHKFDSANVYAVTLEVVNDSGCLGSRTIQLQINSKPNSRFSTGISCELDSTQFINNSTANSGIITDFKWDFGIDTTLADTSILINPVYTYFNDTTFLVRLISTTDLGCKDTLQKNIEVNAKPQAAFTFNSVVFGNEVSFVNNTRIDSGNIVSYLWDFGNGNSATSFNATQRYGSLGKYFVSLLATSDSSCTDAYFDTLEIIPPKPKFNTVYPKNNQFVKREIDFSWNQKESADSYRIQVSNDQLFSTIFIDSAQVLRNNIELSINSFNVYYWRVIALQNSIAIDTTNVSSFNSFSPISIDSLTLWLTGDSVLVDSNNLVSIWFDLSDSSRIVSQTATANQPELFVSVLNGYNVVDFNQNSGYDFFPNVVDINNTNYYISSVYNFHEPVGRFCSFINSSLVGNRWILGPYFKHRLFQGNNFVGEGADIVQDRFVLNTAFAEGDSITNLINGISVGKELSGVKPRDLRIGISNNERMNGSVAEIIMYDGTITQGEKEQLDNYLMDKYAPPVNLGDDRFICSFPDSLFYEKDYIVEYNWNTGDTLSRIEIDSAGLYVLEATDIFGRKSVDSLFYILDTFNRGFSFKEETIEACLGDTIPLSGEIERFKFQWSTGDTSIEISVTSTANYRLTVQNCIGNSFIDSIQVNFNSPRFDLGVDTTICFNSTYVLESDSNFTNVDYIWSTGEVTNSIIANQDQIYYLTVTDQFSCDFTDSIQITIDSSLFSTTLGPDTTLCIGNSIGLYNVPNNQLTYAWSAGSNLPTQLISNAGEYRVSVTNGLCEIADTIQISIKGTAPIVNFVASQFCVRDSVRFNDLSQARANETIVAWNWDFGNGDTSIMQNPNYFYGVVDSFRTQLTVITNTGCSDTSSKVIHVYPNPNSWFGLLESCAKSNASFSDSTSIQSGFISTYRWNFGDTGSANNTSTQRNPIHTFDTLGQYLITLITESDQGCRDTIQRFQQVNATPNVDFSFTGHCLNDSTYFTNETVLAAGQISSHYWTFNTNLIKFQDNSNENPVIQLVDPGTIYVTLREITDKACVSFHQDTFQMRENPVAGLLLSDYCEDVSFTINDNSSSADSISKYTWILEPNDTTFEQNPTFLRNNDGFYLLRQKVESEFGCLDSNVVTLKVNPKPTSRFNILNNGSGRPYSLRVSNNSLDANSYVWHFGNGDSSQAVIPIYEYVDTGSYALSLVAISGIGCADTSTQTLTVSSYLLDALLEDIFLTETFDGRLKVAARVVNSGNNTIETMQLTARLNNDFQFTEQLNKLLFKGDRSAYEFSSTFLQGNEKKVDFVCVKIERLNGILLNEENELCEKAFNNEIKFDVYPNPATEAISLRYVLPFGGDIKFEVFDQLGRRVINQAISTTESGLYFGSQDISFLENGLYTYRFMFNGADYVGHFIKN